MSGKLSRMPRAEQWAKKITAEMNRTVESIVEVGRLLIAAKADLIHGEWSRLFDENLQPLGLKTAQRYMAIAEHPVLSKGAHAHLLPASWTTLYELTKVPETALSNALKDGLVSPQMERKHVKALLPPKQSEPKEYDDQHWMLVLERLRDSIERMVLALPPDVVRLAPAMLHNLAAELEQLNADRGEGNLVADSGADSAVVGGSDAAA